MLLFHGPKTTRRPTCLQEVRAEKRGKDEAPPGGVLWRRADDVIEAQRAAQEELARGKLGRLGVVAADLPPVAVVNEHQPDEQARGGQSITSAIGQSHARFGRKTRRNKRPSYREGAVYFPPAVR